MTVPARSAREFEVKGKTEKTRWREQSESQIGKEEKWQTYWWCRDQQRACRMAKASVEKFEHTGPAERESGVSATK